MGGRRERVIGGYRFMKLMKFKKQFTLSFTSPEKEKCFFLCMM
jgi:hypothetical protein